MPLVRKYYSAEELDLLTEEERQEDWERLVAQREEREAITARLREVDRDPRVRLRPIPTWYRIPKDLFELLPQFEGKCDLPPFHRHIENEFWLAHHWEWLGSWSKDGLPMFSAGKVQKMCAWTYTWRVHFSPVPDGKVPRPACGNERCVNHRHLRLRPIKRSYALTTTQQLEIRQRWLLRKHDPDPSPSKRVSIAKLAEEYGVSRDTIKRTIKEVRSYRHDW